MEKQIDVHQALSRLREIKNKVNPTVEEIKEFFLITFKYPQIKVI